MSSAFIALDWGTSSFRAYLLNKDGTVQETVTAPHGILAVKDGAFDAALESHIGKWDKTLPIMASGMITSRQGWVELPYVACPAGLQVDCRCRSSPHLETRPQNIFRSRHQLRVGSMARPM